MATTITTIIITIMTMVRFRYRNILKLLIAIDFLQN